MIPRMERAVTVRKPPVDPIKPPSDAPVATPLVVDPASTGPVAVESPVAKSSGRTFTWVRQTATGVQFLLAGSSTAVGVGAVGVFEPDVENRW
jgi:hypothetical protein